MSSVIQIPLFVSVYCIVFSSLTYFLKEAAFRAWWVFARWWIPIIVLVSLFQVSSSNRGGGYIGMDKDFDILVLSLLYAVLISVSLWRITRVYWVTK